MKDSEKIKILLEATHLNMREFALEIGLENAQIIYNIVADKHGISRKVARMISDRFPSISTFDEIMAPEDLRIREKPKDTKQGPGIVNTKPTEILRLTDEIKFLKEKIILLQQELDGYKQREKTYLAFINGTTREKTAT